MTDLLAERYELGSELGVGGMGRVVEGYDRMLARQVAVKLLHPNTLAQPGMRDRFLREARAAASFSHPNAVAVYDTGTDDDVPYLVMELVEGRSLAEVLEEQGALDRRQAVAVASQVLSALAAAHRRGFVHRDIKPGNVLLPHGRVPRDASEQPGAKLTDFGIAKGLEQVAAGVTATGQILGTPKYVSPEQVGGQPATPRSDVYSVGVMLYEMLAGQPPFAGESPIALALAHREDPVPPLGRKVRGLDPGLVAVVERALHKDPRQRFADAAQMRSALGNPSTVLGGAGAPATPAPSAATTEMLSAPDEQARPQRTWAPIVLVAVLALALLGIALVDWEGLTARLGPDDEQQPEPVPEEPDDREPEAPELEDPDEPGGEPGQPADPGGGQPDEQGEPDQPDDDQPDDDQPGADPPDSDPPDEEPPDDDPPEQQDPPPDQDEEPGQGADSGAGEDVGGQDQPGEDERGQDGPAGRDPGRGDEDPPAGDEADAPGQEVRPGQAELTALPRSEDSAAR